MDIERVDPSLREALGKLPRLRLEPAFLLWVSALITRIPRTTPVESVTRRIVRVGKIRVIVYTPQNPSGAGLLWIHGGGLVLGAATGDDRMCGETARDTGVTIVSVDYRLAPGAPFPGPLDDCAAAFAWMIEHAQELGIDPGRVAVGGQSAGGGLAAALVQRLHDEGVPLAAQWLFCPMLDDRTAADRQWDAVQHFVWNNRSNLVGWRAYLGDRVGAPRLPDYAAPARREDLTGLPPTWIYWTDIELFEEEDAEYARRLESAGVSVDSVLVPAAPHGFEAWAPDTELARDLLGRARGWLRDRLA